MLSITLAGSYYERGFAHGRMQGAAIANLMAFAQRKLAALPPDSIDHWVRVMQSYTSTHAPYLSEEIEGISAGCGRPLNDLWVLGAASSIAPLGPRCTHVVVPSGLDGPALARTTDVGDDHKYYLLQTTRPQYGIPFVAHGWSGTVWADAGMNAAGLAVGFSTCSGASGQDGEGIPAQWWPRTILERCRTVPEAIEFLSAISAAGKGLNMALVDAHGNAAIIERSGPRQCVRHLESQALFCTNHFVTPVMEGIPPYQKPHFEGNSEARFAYLHSLYAPGTGPTSRMGLQKLLRRHEEPGAICQHKVPGMGTYYAFVMLPAQRQIWVTDGRPCEVPFQCLDLNDLLESDSTRQGGVD